ncbi:cyclic nucleotide-binding domain-containing protein [Cryptosporidium felis]|nr:cyclic nucleotide-binding domain-containing protein [Cryptosporidium felis]
MDSIGENAKDLLQGSQLIDLNHSEKRDDYMDYVSHLQRSTTQLRRENNVLKSDNANLVAKLDRAVSKSRKGIEIPEKATTAEIAEAFGKLSEENCMLKREMERLIRSNTRYRAAMQNKDPAQMPPEEKSYLVNSDESGGRLCQCEYILNEILEAVSYKLETYEKHIWEHRLTTLTNERDEIAVQNISLVDRLAEIEAIIKVDHVLAERFNVPLEGCDEKNQILTLHRKLGFALDVNQQLERRLAFETQLSRSWQSNMHTIVSEYMYELGSIIKQSNGCEIFRTISSLEKQGGSGGGGTGIGEPPGYRRADRESLKLLRLAKQRIEADTKRLETCNKRIIELENEVASLRVRNHSYIYSEGALGRDMASRGIIRDIFPPPKSSPEDLTRGLLGSFSNAQKELLDPIFGEVKEAVEMSQDSRKPEASESKSGNEKAEKDPSKSDSSGNVQNFDNEQNTHRSQHTHRSHHSNQDNQTHRSHYSEQSHRSRHSDQDHQTHRSHHSHRSRHSDQDNQTHRSHHSNHSPSTQKTKEGSHRSHSQSHSQTQRAPKE